MGAYPPTQPPFGNDWRYQRRALRQQAKLQRDLYRAQTRGLRRSSLVGPLLLIFIGVLVLLAEIGHYPWVNLLQRFARWWPLLLIIVGLVRLAEWTFDQRTPASVAPGTPFPRRVLGGGVIALLVLIIVAGVSANVVHGRGAQNLFAHDNLWNQDDLNEFLGDKHESDQTVTESLPAGSQLIVDNPHGDISISGTSSDRQMHISVHKEIFTRSDAEADKKAHELSPEIRTVEGRVMVRLPLSDGARTNVTVTIPPDVPVMINANHGDVRVSMLQAPLMLTANHGDVDVSSITGPTRAHINNSDSSLSARSIVGPIDIAGRGKDVSLADTAGPVSIDGEFFGTTHLAHIDGPIRFHTSRTDLQLVRLNGEFEISPNADLSADQVAGPMVLNTRNRNITLERISGDLTITNRNGAVDLTSAPPLGNISIENRNGSVNVTLPVGVPFNVQADTTNGDVQDDFSLATGGSDNHPTLTGSVGRGGPLVHITTTQGDVTLKSAHIIPLPPMPPMPPVGNLGSMPPEAVRSVRQAQEEARQAVRQAQREIEQARKESEKATKEAGDRHR